MSKLTVTLSPHTLVFAYTCVLDLEKAGLRVPARVKKEMFREMKKMTDEQVDEVEFVENLNHNIN